MEWAADALVLHVRPHGETSAILDVFTRDHGRYGGLVRGGAGRRLRPVLQAGNLVRARWRARLSEHLGTMSVEAGESFAAQAMTQADALAGLLSLCALLRGMPERNAYPRLYDTATALLAHLVAGDDWLGHLVRFELVLLEESGFGLDLSHCAATGGTKDLAYVSPRSGRAVSRDAAKPYVAQLFALPDFLTRPDAPATRADILNGLALTGHFLERRLYTPHNMAVPAARTRLIERLARF